MLGLPVTVVEDLTEVDHGTMAGLLAVPVATALGWKQPNDVIYQIDPEQRTRTAICISAVS